MSLAVSDTLTPGVISTTKQPFGGQNMFTYMTATNPASESRNPPSKSFVLNNSSINDGEYFVSDFFLLGMK
jgi:hypothetical protein